MDEEWGAVELPTFESLWSECLKLQNAASNRDLHSETPTDEDGRPETASRWEQTAVLMGWKKSQLLVRRGLVTEDLEESYTVLRRVLIELDEKGEQRASMLVAKLDSFLESAATIGEMKNAKAHFHDLDVLMGTLCMDPSIDEATEALLLTHTNRIVRSHGRLKCVTNSVNALLTEVRKTSLYRKEQGAVLPQNSKLLQMVPDNGNAEDAAQALEQMLALRLQRLPGAAHTIQAFHSQMQKKWAIQQAVYGWAAAASGDPAGYRQHWAGYIARQGFAALADDAMNATATTQESVPWPEERSLPPPSWGATGAVATVDKTTQLDEKPLHSRLKRVPSIAAPVAKRRLRLQPETIEGKESICQNLAASQGEQLQTRRARLLKELKKKPIQHENMRRQLKRMQSSLQPTKVPNCSDHSTSSSR